MPNGANGCHENDQDAQEHGSPWEISVDKTAVTVSFGQHVLLVTKSKDAHYVLSIYSNESRKRIVVRDIGARTLEFTKISSSSWAEIRTKIGLSEDLKEEFASDVIAAAEKMSLLEKEEATQAALSPEQKERALAVLRKEDLDDFIKKTLDKVIIGEDLTKETVFHCCLSAYTHDSFSIKLEGASRGGKDAVASKTLDLLPPEDVEVYGGGMTRRAIEWLAAAEKEKNYTLELKGKIWYFPDMEEETAQILKVLLSEGKKERLVTLKEENRLVSRKLIVEGKPACLFTTTVPTVDPQFENRLLKRGIDETQEQTKKVHLYKQKYHAD